MTVQIFCDKRTYLVALCVVLLSIVLVPLDSEVCGEHTLPNFARPMSDLCNAIKNTLYVMSQTLLCVVVANDIMERLRLMKLNRQQKRALANGQSMLVPM